MAENDKQGGQNLGAHQGTVDNERDLAGNKTDAGSATNETTGEDESQTVPSEMRRGTKTGVSPEPAGDVEGGYTRTAAFENELRQGDTETTRMSDKGDMGKEGSMHESFESEEGYRTMDEDENRKDSLKKGDNSTMGNP